MRRTYRSARPPFIVAVPAGRPCGPAVVARANAPVRGRLASVCADGQGLGDDLAADDRPRITWVSGGDLESSSVAGSALYPGVATGLRVIDALEIPQEGTDTMASSSKKKTTMAKLNRENAVRERRLRKQAKKDARKQAAAAPPARPSDTPTGEDR
jgi:hypothetical protein